MRFGSAEELEEVFELHSTADKTSCAGSILLVIFYFACVLVLDCQVLV